MVEVATVGEVATVAVATAETGVGAAASNTASVCLNVPSIPNTGLS